MSESRTPSRDRAQTPVGRAAQLADERVEDPLLILLAPIGDGADHRTLTLQQGGDRLIDRACCE